MNDNRVYPPEFYKSQIAAAELELMKPISAEDKVRAQARLAAARSYLKQAEGK